MPQNHVQTHAQNHGQVNPPENNVQFFFLGALPRTLIVGATAPAITPLLRLAQCIGGAITLSVTLLRVTSLGKNITLTQHQFPLCSNGVCIGSAINNRVEYDVIIRLMCDSLHQGIFHIHVYLDS